MQKEYTQALFYILVVVFFAILFSSVAFKWIKYFKWATNTNGLSFKARGHACMQSIGLLHKHIAAQRSVLQKMYFNA